jgi:hypothetical protein
MSTLRNKDPNSLGFISFEDNKGYNLITVKITIISKSYEDRIKRKISEEDLNSASRPFCNRTETFIETGLIEFNFTPKRLGFFFHKSLLFFTFSPIVQFLFSSNSLSVRYYMFLANV